MSKGNPTVEEIKNSIGYCGLVCKLCHVADTCDGCKTENNCCGRHLSAEGCYQYNCCVERGLDGCWECKDFSCEKDMFSDSHDIRLRAFVRCAKEEGVDKLAEYVFCVNGQYTAFLNDKEFVLNPGDELFIPKGTEQWGKCIAGTRTIHAFGGKRIQR